MPYGIPKEHGGDSLENISKMRACIEDIMAKGADKVTAIRECKVSLGFTSGPRKRIRARS